MGLRCSDSLSLVILNLGLCYGQAGLRRAVTELIQYCYDSGYHGLQLLVFPSHGQEVPLKLWLNFGQSLKLKVFLTLNCNVQSGFTLS